MDSQLISQYQSSWILTAAVSMAVLFILSFCGFALLKLWPALRISRSPYAFFCESLLLGFLVFSIMAFAGVLLGVQLDHTFLALSLVSACMLFLAYQKPYVGEPGRDLIEYRQDDDHFQILALILIVVGAVLWSTYNLRGLEATDTGIVLVPWIDTFFHAKQIGSFARFDGDIGTLNLTKYGQPLGPYHYGSYMVAGLISRVGNIPSLQIATSVYPILGMVLTGASMFVLASLVSGPRGTLLAIAVLFFLPDPSCWVPGLPRSNSYFFFQQVGVGAAYAVAIMGLALAHALRAFRCQSLALCILALGVFTVASLFKVQIFLAYSFFFFLYVIWNADWLSIKIRLIASAAFVSAFYLSALKLADIPGAPTFEITLAGIESNVEFITKFISPPPLPLFMMIAVIPVAGIVVFSIGYGILFPASAFLTWKLRENSAARKMIVLLVLAFLSHACVRLLIADNVGNGDTAEVNRKTFVWPYFMIVFSFSSLLLTYLDQRRANYFQRKPVLVVLFVGFFVLSGISARKLQEWPGLSGLIKAPVPRGLFEAATYLRQHSLPGEVVQLCENDVMNQLSTLAERPVFIAKYKVYRGATTLLEQQRFAFVDGIVQADKLQTAALRMSQAKISWLLMSPKCESPWEGQLNPAFTADGYRLYEAARFQ